MNTQIDFTDPELNRLARLWIRAWRLAGSPDMTAHETTWNYPALTKIPAQICGIRTTNDYKKAEARICVECCGRERGDRGKTFLVRVALDFSTITHIVAPLAGLTMNIAGTANIECAGGQRKVAKAMLVLMERMHINVAIHLRSREALRDMSGPAIDAAHARIEEAEIRDVLRTAETQSCQMPTRRL